MCYSVAFMESRKAKYAKRFKELIKEPLKESDLSGELPLFYFVSGFSHPHLPIVTQKGIFQYEWGLIPTWVKDLDTANQIKDKTLNAVGETVFEKPSFRKSISSQRCLLGISGFYEWMDLNKVKYPFFIQTKSNEIFSLGCIYENWVDLTTGEIKNTFSILTTPANPMMEKIHNIKKRMPLILSSQDEEKWLDPKLKKEDIISLIKPYDENDMKAYTISRRINSPKFDRNIPESIDFVEYPELALLA